MSNGVTAHTHTHTHTHTHLLGSENLKTLDTVGRARCKKLVKVVRVCRGRRAYELAHSLGRKAMCL